jgi:4'-phosphopantetheinyl transferase EntD
LPVISHAATVAGPSIRQESLLYAAAKLIEKILPDVVASVEAFDDPPDAVLYPGEAEVISRAVDKRRREFRTVRHCARQALRQLGLPPVSVLPGERGEPQWPPGVVGSMTHCGGYRAAAVARSCDLRTLGIDAEPHQPLPAGVLNTIALDEERNNLSELAAADSATCWDRILFCAKEAVYKAWFPLTRRWLGFEDAHVTINPGTIDPAHGTFSAHLLVDGSTITGKALTHVNGHWLRTNELLITAIALPVADLAC